MKDFFLLVKAVYSNSARFRNTNQKRKRSATSELLSWILVALVFGLYLSLEVLPQIGNVAGATEDPVLRFQYLRILFASYCFYCVFILMTLVRPVFFDEEAKAFLCLPVSRSRLFFARVILLYLHSMTYCGIGCLVLPIGAVCFFHLGLYPLLASIFLGIILPPFLLSVSLFLTFVLGKIFPLSSKGGAKAFQGLTSFLASAFLVLSYLVPFSFGETMDLSNVPLIARYGVFFVWAGVLPEQVLSSDYRVLFLLLLLALTALLLFASIRLSGTREESFATSRKRSRAPRKDVVEKAFRKAENPSYFFVRQSFSEVPFGFYFASLSVSLSFLFTFALTLTIGGSNGDMGPYFPLLITLLGTTLTVSNPFLPTSAISLEKENFFLLKTLPFPERKYLFAHYLPSLLFGFLLSLLSSLTLPLISRQSVGDLFASVFFGLAYSFSYTSLMYLFGIRFARFNYATQSEIHTQGWNSLLFWLVSLLYSGLAVAVSLPFLLLLPGMPYVSYLSLGGLALLFGFLFVAFFPKAYHGLLRKDFFD